MGLGQTYFLGKFEGCYSWKLSRVSEQLVNRAGSEKPEGGPRQ